MWNLDQIVSLIPRDIIIMIKAIPLSKYSSVSDGVRWIFSNDGNFTIKSAYHNHSPNQRILLPLSNMWPKLWKIDAPFKYKMLLWNIMHEILPTTTVLPKKINNFDHIHIVNVVVLILKLMYICFEIVSMQAYFGKEFFKLAI